MHERVEARRKHVESQLQTCLKPSDDRTCVTYIRPVFRKMDDEDEIVVACNCSRGVQFRYRNDSVQVEETETLHSPHG